MSTPLSLFDVSARYGQAPAPQKTVEEQTGWDPGTLFRDYLNKVRRQQKEQEEHAAEDALLAMIDAMNASKEDRRAGPERVAAEALMRAGPSVQQSEELQELRERSGGRIDVTDMPELQALMMCLCSAERLGRLDGVQEQRPEEQRPTEQRGLSGPGET